MTSRTVPGVLAYTLCKQEDGSSTMLFLVWRDRRNSSYESSTYWSNVVCPPSKDDHSPLDAACRVFAEKTKGVFAPTTMVYENEHEMEVVARKSAAKQKVEECKISLRKKIVAGKGVTLLNVKQYLTYVVPVKFVDSSSMNAAFGADKGEAEWVTAHDLFGSIFAPVPENLVAVRCKPFLTPTTQTSQFVTLPLAMPFTLTMRAKEARGELAEILKQFGVDCQALNEAIALGEKEDAAEATTTPSDASSSSSVAAASASSVAASSTAAAPAAAPSVPGAAAAATPSSSSSSSSAPEAVSRPVETNYCCRKCRTVLFSDVDLTSHTLPKNGGGKFAHKYNKAADGGARRVQTECFSYFIENNEVLGQFPPGEGPLLCKKCGTRYGYYVWSGEQCSCGEWISPSFQVVKSKVDAKQIGGIGKSAHVHFQFQRPAVVRPFGNNATSSSTAASSGADATASSASPAASTSPATDAATASLASLSVSNAAP